MSEPNVCVIVGAGPQLGAAVGRRFAKAGLKVVLVSRTQSRLDEIAAGIDGAIGMACDATNEDQVNALIDKIEAEVGQIAVGVYNPGGGFNRTHVVEQTAERMRQVWEFTAFGGFLFGRAVARKMVARKFGTILYTGATASLRGGPGFSAFASGKFALRALAQSMARELHPEGVHIAHINIDGIIGESEDGSKLNPDAIAETYYGLFKQDRSNWTQELDVRPWSEKF